MKHSIGVAVAAGLLCASGACHGQQTSPPKGVYAFGADQTVAGIVPYVPRPQRGPSVRAGLFRKDEFRYDADSDSYVCPAGQRLYPYLSSLLRGLKKINYVNKLACDDCKISSQCTNGQFRAVSRLDNEAVGSDAGPVGETPWCPRLASRDG